MKLNEIISSKVAAHLREFSVVSMIPVPIAAPSFSLKAEDVTRLNQFIRFLVMLELYRQFRNHINTDEAVAVYNFLIKQIIASEVKKSVLFKHFQIDYPFRPVIHSQRFIQRRQFIFAHVESNEITPFTEPSTFLFNVFHPSHNVSLADPRALCRFIGDSNTLTLSESVLRPFKSSIVSCCIILHFALSPITHSKYMFRRFLFLLGRMIYDYANHFHSISFRIVCKPKLITSTFIHQALYYLFDDANCYVKPSRIPHAGLGLFARHALNKAQFVVQYKGVLKVDDGSVQSYAMQIAGDRLRGVDKKNTYIIDGENQLAGFANTASAKQSAKNNLQSDEAGHGTNLQGLWLKTSKRISKDAELLLLYERDVWRNFENDQKDKLNTDEDVPTQTPPFSGVEIPTTLQLRVTRLTTASTTARQSRTSRRAAEAEEVAQTIDVPSFKLKSTATLKAKLTTLTTAYRKSTHSTGDTQTIQPAYIKKIIQFFDKPTCFLDIGCGAGIVCIGMNLENPQCRIIGLDINRNMIHAANTLSKNANVTAEFEIADVCNLPVDYLITRQVSNVYSFFGVFPAFATSFVMSMIRFATDHGDFLRQVILSAKQGSKPAMDTDTWDSVSLKSMHMSGTSSGTYTFYGFTRKLFLN